MEDRESLGKWFFRVWKTYPFRMLGVNCLFLIACLPIVTIPAAYCGMNAVVQKIYRRIFTMSVFRDFFEAFKEDFLKRLFLTISIIIIPFIIALVLYGRMDMIVWYGITATLVVMVFIILSWFIPQLVLLNLKPIQALKNSFIFMTMCSGKNFFLVLIWTICLTVTLWGWPMSGFLLVIIPVIQVMLITGITMPIFKQYLIQENDCYNE